VEVLAVKFEGKRRIWVVNLTDQPVAMTLAGLDAGSVIRMERGATLAAEQPKALSATAKGEIALDIAPIEICRLIIEN
jgi:hypothetical protein